MCLSMFVPVCILVTGRAVYEPLEPGCSPKPAQDWHFWYSHCQIYNRLPEVHYDMEGLPTTSSI